MKYKGPGENSFECWPVRFLEMFKKCVDSFLECLEVYTLLYTYTRKQEQLVEYCGNFSEGNIKAEEGQQL